MPIPISGVSSTLPINSVTPKQPADTSGSVSGGSFQDVLGNAMNSLSQMQSQADTAATQLASGQPVELHQALLATEEASLDFQLAVQVRNKIIDAYQEIMRMQV
jgi:flagellar hook-basal body complex protein FliE